MKSVLISVEESTFEERLEGEERASLVGSLGRMSQIGQSMCKGPEAGTWAPRNGRKTLRLEQKMHVEDKDVWQEMRFWR